MYFEESAYKSLQDAHDANKSSERGNDYGMTTDTTIGSDDERDWSERDEDDE